MADIARARQLRKVETWAEKLVWNWLRARRFTGYKFRRQHPLGIYYLDFFCEEAELNVELDGSQHGFPDQRKHDLEPKFISWPTSPALASFASLNPGRKNLSGAGCAHGGSPATNFAASIPSAFTIWISFARRRN